MTISQEKARDAATDAMFKILETSEALLDWQRAVEQAARPGGEPAPGREAVSDEIRKLREAADGLLADFTLVSNRAGMSGIYG